jgi:beta-phosphoglucomutase family hydrolase
MERSPTHDATPYDAVILDLDGVITSTDALHFQAWKDTFDAFLARRDPPGAAFTEADYRRTVDGKPRFDGVRDFLASRGLEVPEGTPSDPPDPPTVQGLGRAKNERLQQLLREGRVEAFDDASRAIERWRASGLRLAVVSSSRNCRPVLDAVGLLGCFDAVADGVVADDLGLPGKPAPDLFLEAARRLDVDPARAVVVEDAEVGVDAGRRGGFGLVVGMDRAGTGARLREHGAHVVLASLDDLEVTR